jgi:transcriptional regulator with XRE-family HTH domain
MEENLIFVKNIKEIIKSSGFKQKAIADRAGYDQKKFSDMLNGRKIITAADIIPIAEALGVQPNDLFARAPDKMV